MPEQKPDSGSSYLRAMVLLGGRDLDEEQQALVDELVGANPGWFLERVTDEWGPVELARRGVEAGAELIVAAGGDGTVSAVAEAVAGRGVPMAILPFGTANDFARTLSVATLDEARRALALGHIVDADGVRVETREGVEHFVLNVANGGLAWDIGDSLDDDTKGAWGPLAYARGALDVIGHPTVHTVRVQVDDELPREERVLTVAVSSGRTCGGGLILAPTGDPQDGLLEVTLLLEAPPGAVAALAARMRVADVETDDGLVRLRGRSMSVESDPPMRFVLDGELAEEHPTRFSVLPGAVRIHVGEHYTREPALA